MTARFIVFDPEAYIYVDGIPGTRDETVIFEIPKHVRTLSYTEKNADILVEFAKQSINKHRDDIRKVMQ